MTAALAVHAHHALVVAVVQHGGRIAIRHATRQIIAQIAALLLRRPAVSVITPTWRRRLLLSCRCISSVQAQTYRGPISHVIVSDGPDEDLTDVDGVKFLPAHIPERNKGLAARRHGTDLADGELVAYLDDDNAWRPQHLEKLVAALTRTGADFAYSRALCHDSGRSWSIGQSPPGFAQIDTSLVVHRRELLEVATWEPSTGPADWDLISRWVRTGARWVHVPQITMDYYHSEDAEHAGHKTH